MPTSFPMSNPWVAGEAVTDVSMLARTTTPINDLAATVATINAGAWTAYTPALTATTTNPGLGTGSSVRGSYSQLGKTVLASVYIACGTGATAGSGTYTVSLPVAWVGTSGPLITIGYGHVLAAGVWTAVIAVASTAGSTCTMRYVNAAINGSRLAVSNSTPGVWGTSGDAIILNLQYEAA